MDTNNGSAWRRLAAAAWAVMVVSGCGGGGGSGAGSDNAPPPAPAYSLVQPAAAPASESIDTTRASGTVSASADTLAAAGHQAGITVELHAIQTDGGLSATLASGTTAADGSFSIAMPTGKSTGDGGWMLVAQIGGSPVRAYLHSGAVRLDASSEAWVRAVATAAGHGLSFPSPSLTTLRAVARSLALYADATGDQRSTLTVSAAADDILKSLSQDPALQFVLTTLQTTGALPTAGTGDIGAFHAVVKDYAGSFVDDTHLQMLAYRTISYGTSVAADGSWSYNEYVASQANGQWTPIVGKGGGGRISASNEYEHVNGSGTAAAQLSTVIGEYPSHSFPVQAGTRQLDSRRITATGLNFTGGTDEQPLAFSVNETVTGVESVTLAAGTFRALKVVTEVQFVLPKSATTISNVIQRSTLWLVPGIGIVKDVEQVFADGVEDTSATGTHIEATGAYAHNLSWPALISMKYNGYYGADVTRYCAPVLLPALRRYVTVESDVILNGSPQLALALWDLDSGQKIGSTRLFTAYSAQCPQAAGTSSSVLVAEAFLARNQAPYVWPADQASATAQSDIVHQVSGLDLSEVATYRLPAVPDPTHGNLYQPASIDALMPATDASGQFAVSTVMTNYWGLVGSTPEYLQILGPGVSSTVVNAGTVRTLGADWNSGQLFTDTTATPFPLVVYPFTAAAGTWAASARTIGTGIPVAQLWYASAHRLHLNDGSTIELADGSAGPKAPFGTDSCGYALSVLICVDRANDQLVRFDPDTLTVTGTAPLASMLRAQSLTAPDFRSMSLNFRSVVVFDASTVLIAGQTIHVGQWH